MRSRKCASIRISPSLLWILVIWKEALLVAGQCTAGAADTGDPVMCKDWAGLGECSANKPYMDKECCASCRTLPPACQDVYPAECPDWAKFGECTNTPLFMTKLCCTSCTATSVCADLHATCNAWAAAGPNECANSARYMLFHCCAACKAAGFAVTPTPG